MEDQANQQRALNSQCESLMADLDAYRDFTIIHPTSETHERPQI